MTKKYIQLRLGAISDTIAKQLKKQKIAFDEKEIQVLQDDAIAITRLRIRGYIPDKMLSNMQKKLFDRISAHVDTFQSSKKKPAKTSKKS